MFSEFLSTYEVVEFDVDPLSIVKTKLHSQTDVVTRRSKRLSS